MEKRKDFFVGIDSDGTVFDSMTIKHRDAFIPAAFEVWELESCRNKFIELWEKVNLTSETRGINRFLALLSVFEKLSSEHCRLPDFSALELFCKSQPLSNAGLTAFIAANKDETLSPFLSELIRWSRLSDELFDKAVAGLPPFDYAKDAIVFMSEHADIMVVSSAALAGIQKDWTAAGLMPYVARVAGQESGSKKQQLESGASGKYTPERTLMIGDTPGDLEAAEHVGAYFYPIIPGNESDSWKMLIERYYDMFIAGTYGNVQEELLEKFRASME